MKLAACILALHAFSFGCVVQTVIAAPSDLAQPKAVWEAGSATLTILDRKGEWFRGLFQRENGKIIREMTGVVKDDYITWRSQDQRVIAGHGSGDWYCTFDGDKLYVNTYNNDGTAHYIMSLRHPTGSATPSVLAPPSPPPPTANVPSSIDELIDRKNVFVDDIFSPLDHDIPPTVRDLLADLRENLLDEGARHPVVNVRAYQMAAQYCNGLITAYDERMQGEARLRNDAPSNAAGGPSVQKIHPNWIDYQRERAEAAAATHNNTLQTGLARMNIVQWNLRGAELRKNLDAYYSQFRAIARQPVSAK